MTTKDTIKYIRSKAVREHLESIDYEPSVLEAAYFIMDSVRELTFAQQKSLLLDLALSNAASAEEGGDDSAAIIYEYIEKSEAFIKDFESAAFGEYYMFQWKWNRYDDDEPHLCAEFAPAYSSFEKCIDAAFSFYSKMEYDDSSVDYNFLRVIKRRINDDSFFRIAFYKINRDVISPDELDFCHVCDFDNRIRLFNIEDKIHIPLPFKPGDVVRFNTHYEPPFLIVNMPDKDEAYGSAVFADWNTCHWNIHVMDYAFKRKDLFHMDYAKILESEEQALEPLAKYIKGEWPKEVARMRMEKMNDDNLSDFFEDLTAHLNKQKENPKD